MLLTDLSGFNDFKKKLVICSQSRQRYTFSNEEGLKSLNLKICVFYISTNRHLYEEIYLKHLVKTHPGFSAHIWNLTESNQISCLNDRLRDLTLNLYIWGFLKEQKGRKA